MKILDLIQSEGFRLKKVSSTNGGEYAGACPFCGGRDRFRVQPERGERGRFYCRGCNDRWSDDIEFIRKLKGIGYIDACKYLEIPPKEKQADWKSEPDPEWEPRHIPPPVDTWQKKALEFLQGTQKALWSDSCADVRQWLHEARRLSDDTIRKTGLGWNPKADYPAREAWGLGTIISEKTRRPQKIFIPKGLVIPCFEGNKIARLRVRMPDDEMQRVMNQWGIDEIDRYRHIPGGSTIPMILKSDVFCIVESELDAILLWQECGNLVTPVALGNAQIKPDDNTHEKLSQSDLILVSLDADEAGGKNSWEWWYEQYPEKFQRLPPIDGKDPTEMLLNDGNLRDWIRLGINLARKPKAPPQPGPTTDPVRILKSRARQFFQKQCDYCTAAYTSDDYLADTELDRLMDKAEAVYRNLRTESDLKEIRDLLRSYCQLFKTYQRTANGQRTIGTHSTPTETAPA